MRSSARRTRPPGRAAFTTFAFGAPAQRIALQASDECYVVFVGYQD